MASTGGVNSIEVLSKALDGLALRQRVNANNVANVDTPGFKASTVTFEDALQRAMQPQRSALLLASTNVRHFTASADPAGATPQVVQLTSTTGRNDGNNVDIEQQMALVAETSLRFQAVSEVLSRQLAMRQMIARDGR